MDGDTQHQTHQPPTTPAQTAIDIGDRAVNPLLFFVLLVYDLVISLDHLILFDHLIHFDWCRCWSWWWYQYAVRAMPYDRRPLLASSATHPPIVGTRHT
jgi:hypothetical protein